MVIDLGKKIPIVVTTVPRQALETFSGRPSVAGRGTNPTFGHTKPFTKDSTSFPSLALRYVGLALRLTRWCQDKWTSSTGKLLRKRRDITEKMLIAA